MTAYAKLRALKLAIDALHAAAEVESDDAVADELRALARELDGKRRILGGFP